MRGTVRWFDTRKGYGFIEPEDGKKDVFVHHSGVQGGGTRLLQTGDEVEFDVEQEDRGPKAIHVNRVKWNKPPRRRHRRSVPGRS